MNFELVLKDKKDYVLSFEVLENEKVPFDLSLENKSEEKIKEIAINLFKEIYTEFLDKAVEKVEVDDFLEITKPRSKKRGYYKIEGHHVNALKVLKNTSEELFNACVDIVQDTRFPLQRELNKQIFDKYRILQIDGGDIDYIKIRSGRY